MGENEDREQRLHDARMAVAGQAHRDALDAARYRFLRDGEYPETLLGKLVVEGVHRDEVDAAIDAALEHSSKDSK